MLKTAKDLITYEYDGKKAYLNPVFARPIIFKKGIEIVDAIIDNPSLSENSELIELLVKYHILVEYEDKPESFQKFDLEGKSELALYLLVTQKCNLGCTYCLGDNPSYLDQKDMDINVTKKAIDKAIESMKHGGYLQIIYFGGEPLLNWDSVKECLFYVESKIINHKNLRIRHNITTNLTNLPNDFINIAKEYNLSILVDLDGNCSIHDKMRPFKGGMGSYDKIISNIDLLDSSNLQFELRATITKDNVEYIPEILKHHAKLRAKSCAFPTLIPVNSEGKPIDKNLYPDPKIYYEGLAEAIEQQIYDLSNICPSNVLALRMLRGEFVVYGCGMILGNTSVVDHNGDVYPCIYFVGQRDFILGNINDAENPFIQKNFYDKFYRKYQKQLHVENIEECKKCSIRYFCGGGCSVRLLALKENNADSKFAREYFEKITCNTAWASIKSTIKYFDLKTKKGSAYRIKMKKQI